MIWKHTEETKNKISKKCKWIKWKDIPLFEWLYQCNKVWSIKSLIKRNWTNTRLLKPWRTPDLYYKVILYKNWKKYTRLVHRLVWQTFIKNKENKPCINHKDWNKWNNRIENLEWCTHQENVKYSFKKLWRKWTRLWKRWKLNPQSIKINQYTREWKLIKIRDSMMDIRRNLKIDLSSLWKCCNWKRKTAWNYIRKYFNT